MTIMNCTKHPLYKTWEQMRARCNNPNSPRYYHYGKRGIAVCREWDDFWQFVADMGERPKGHTLDRIDNDGPYAPWNCRWADRKTQDRNKRTNRVLTFQGRSMCMTDWAEELGFKFVTLQKRLRIGWSVEKALSTPTKK